MIDRPPTDFLRGTPVLPTDETGVDAILNLEYAALKSIRTELRKQNPSVLTLPVVQGAIQQGQGGINNRIADQNTHEVFFTISGKPTAIYKLFLFTTNGNQIINLSNRPSSNTDGFRPAANTLIYFPVEMREIYIQAVNATPFTVNGPFTAAEGLLYLWGFTTPDIDVPDWE